VPLDPVSTKSREGHFLRNHGKEIASIDLFVVPTIAFRRLSSLAINGGNYWDLR
jgi:hypothetical protein